MAAIVVPLPPRACQTVAKPAPKPLLLALWDVLRPAAKPRRPYRRPRGPILFSEYGLGPRPRG